jgi:prolipoprotein diacylglyceryl transferase
LNPDPSSVIASIPAPAWDSLSIGPLSFQLYGLCIAIGVLVAVWVGQRRWRDWGGDPDDIVTVAIWAVPAGLIGARLYHVITDWNSLYSDGNWQEAFKIWKGGLGIPGGVLLGSIVGIIVAKRLVNRPGLLADAAVAGIPIAQAIGRLGNYFNQELYGGPTNLPWALEVDLNHRPTDQLDVATFHPAFLYEGIWNLGLAALIILGSKRLILKPARWFAVYMIGYGLGRLWVELIRIDDATLIAGIRVNIWMSFTIILVGLVWLLWGGGPVDADGNARLAAGETHKQIFGELTHHIGSDSGEGAEPVEDDTPDGEPGADQVSVDESGPDPITEGGPGADSPLAEGTAAEDDAEGVVDRVDPEKTA